MQHDFVVTSIRRIVFVDRNEYSDRLLHFGTHFQANELIFSLSGASTVYFDDVILEAEPDTVRLLPMGKHHTYTVETKEDGDCILIAFKTDRPISQEAFLMKVNHIPQLRALFKKIFSVWVAKADGYYFECLSLLYKILAQLQKIDYLPQKEYLKIKPAVTYIEENFLQETISGKALTKLCGISQSYMDRLFVKKFGMSPKKYAVHLKINYACDLLKSKNFLVSEVAEICGYSDVYFFSRQFKTYMGLTPSAYIEKYRSSK